LPHKGIQKYTFDEIKKHNTTKSCWLVIKNKVYDTTEFISQHPGGNFMLLGAGRDCTHLFQSYHPLYVANMVEKYYIGEIEREVKYPSQYSKEEDMLYDDDKSGFYTTVKTRVEQYFKDHHINPRFSYHMILKTILVFTILAVSYYYAFFF